MFGSASKGQTFTKKIADKKRDASARVISDGTLSHIELTGVESEANCINARRARERVKVVSVPAKSSCIERRRIQVRSATACADAV